MAWRADCPTRDLVCSPPRLHTGNIKFTYEEESEGSLPFLDTLMVWTEDGTIKLLVYRKKTHPDQYLNFSSHHPLHQKLGVIKTLLDRCNNIVTDPEDRRRVHQQGKEEEYISKGKKKSTSARERRRVHQQGSSGVLLP